MTRVYHVRHSQLANCMKSASTLADYCRAFDIFTDVFETAEQAVAMLQDKAVRYDLIVIEPDGMLGMGGYAFCSWFRQNEATLPGSQPGARGRPLPTSVIVLSASPEPENARAFGAHSYLSKPLSPTCFAVAILNWITTRERLRKGAQGAQSESSSTTGGGPGEATELQVESTGMTA